MLITIEKSKQQHFKTLISIDQKLDGMSCVIQNVLI